jgi:hemolysin activation/secretion protein
MLKKQILWVVIASLPATVFAAVPSVLPPSIDPARAGQQLNLPPVISSPSPGVVTKPTPVEPTPSGAEAVTFILNKLEISGNTVFSTTQLSPLFQQYLGKEISLADLHKVTRAITLKYRDAGYILTRAIIPAQIIDKGEVKIQVVEGYVTSAQIEGSADGADKLINNYGKATTNLRPLNIKGLERYSLLANDIPGMNQVKMILQPPTDPNAPLGSSNLQMVPDFSKVSGFVSVDNRGTRYLGPNEVSAGGAVNSIIQSGDQWGMQGLASTDWSELKFINLYTAQPLGATGATFDLSGNYSQTQPGFLLTPLKVFGQSKEVITDVKVPWIRTRKQTLYTTLAFDYLNNLTDIDAFNANLFNDHIRSVRLAANYYIQDGWAGANQIGLQVSHGLPILNASDFNQPTQSRYLGDPQYTKLNGTLSRLQGITENSSFLIAGIGQYTNNPLLSAEQFAFGGTQYGQAYDPAEITGDRGVAGKAELRYNQSPGWKYLNSLQYFTFYDIGKVWNVLPADLTGLPQQQSAASAGVGVRISFNQYVFGAAEFAQPLTKVVATYGDTTPRIFVSLTITGKTHNTSDEPSPFPALDETPAGYGNSSAATNGPVAQAATGLSTQ